MDTVKKKKLEALLKVYNLTFKDLPAFPKTKDIESLIITIGEAKLRRKKK